jgi:hypothetical protein
MKLLVLFLAMSAVAAAQADPDAVRDAKLIAEVKSVSVHKIDDTLAEISFKKWLEEESGDGTQFHWEVNDCGEQTGTPGDGPVPICVEVDSSLKDGRQIVIFLTIDQNAKNAPPDWKIFFAQLVAPREKITLRRLSELPAALIKTRPLNHPEIAQ